MPRKNTKAELPLKVNEVGMFTEKAAGNSVTVTDALVAGAKTTVTVASATGFVDEDWLRIRGLHDRPEINQIESLAGAVLTPRYRHQIGSPIGSAVRAMQQTSLGHISEGVAFSLSAQEEEILADTRSLPLTHLLGHLKPNVKFSVLGINLDNLLASIGMLEGSPNITGTGTSSDPFKSFIDGNKMDENSASSWYVNATRKDGRTLTTIFMDCNLMYDGKELAAGRGRKTLIQFEVVPSIVRWLEVD